MLDIEFPEVDLTDEKSMPSLNHSYLCTQIMRQLLQNPAILPLAELTLDIEKGLTPDICVYPADKINPDFFNDIPQYQELPMIAIEVISPSQNIQALLIKARKLAEAGIRSVMTLDPFSRTVFLTQHGMENRILHNQAVEAEGIRIDFKRIFEKQP